MSTWTFFGSRGLDHHLIFNQYVSHILTVSKYQVCSYEFDLFTQVSDSGHHDPLFGLNLQRVYQYSRGFQLFHDIVKIKHPLNEVPYS